MIEPDHASDAPRVLFLCSTLAVGGAERQLALLVRALGDTGYAPAVATLRDRGRYFDLLQAEGVPMRFVAMRSRVDVLGAWRAFRLWSRRPDVVFTRSADAQLIGHFLARRCGAPHVTAEHGGFGIHRPLHHRLTTRFVARRADRVVAVSPTQIAELVRVGYRANRISVIPNGIPDANPARNAASVRRELGLDPSRVVFLFVATLRPEKRVGLFLEAVAAAHAQDPRVCGVIAGGGPDLEMVRARSSLPAVSDAFRALGERSDVPDLMVAADAVCLTSDVEGLPLAVLEAMASSRPVVATAVGGIRDLVEPERTGWLVPPSDVLAYSEALVAAAADPEKRRALGGAARRAYEDRYTLDRMVESYRALLDEVVGTRQRRRGS